MKLSKSNLSLTDSLDNFYRPHHIYIHFPYCLYKCHYCDFNSHAHERGQIPLGRYTQSLLAEMKRRRHIHEQSGRSFFARDSRIESIFFGGGTPSLMNPSDVAIILEHLQKYFLFSPNIEITLEANPGTLTKESIREFCKAGINRVSMGMQSLNDAYLKKYGRIHSAAQALEALDWLLDSDLARVSVDLIYGFPGQESSDWEMQLNTILSRPLSHLSCYALTVEEGTLLAKQVRDGLVAAPDPDRQASFQELSYDRLGRAKLESYEISNFARSGEECRHNLAYWQYHSYLGLGAGAVSQFVNLSPDQKIKVRRESNHRAPEHYQNSVNSTQDFYISEGIDLSTAIKEYMMMGLRLKKGVTENDFAELFGVTLPQVFGQTLIDKIQQGYLESSKGMISPTRAGMLFNNKVIKDLFAAVQS